MIVCPIAVTKMLWSNVRSQTEYVPHQTDSDPDQLAELAGRACYESWDRPNPETATNDAYLANILGKQHFSVLEHASVSFYVAGVSRTLTHELVRHRHLSFSQVSQRYVDESENGVVIPPVVDSDILKQAYSQADADARRLYKSIYLILRDSGHDLKAARGAARAVLLNASPTKLVVSGNLRAWREVLEKRLSPAADAEIRLLAQKILFYLKRLAPNTFQDFDEP